MRRIVYSVSTVLSCLAIVGCNFKGNTDMQRKSELNCQKWDAFATKVGVQTCQEAYKPLVHDREYLKNYFSKIPSHYSPNSNNIKDYKYVLDNANAYNNKLFSKVKATEIVSIEKLSTVIKSTNNSDQLKIKKELTFVSIPYFERDADIQKNTYKDLSEIKSESGIDENSNFSIYKTKEAIVLNGNNSIAQAKPERAEGEVYVIKYKLTESETVYSALLTIPKNLTDKDKLPLMVYAHGGDSGISFRNMASILQDNLGKAIVIAPSFPGEPICSVTTLGGKVKINALRQCADSNNNIVAPVVEAQGNKSPLDEDVVSLLGLHNAITNFVLGSKHLKTNEDKHADETKQIRLKLQKHLAFHIDPTINKIAAGLLGIKTIGVSDSRGGATLLAAIGRSGLKLKDVMDFNSFELPPLFSASAHLYSPSSLLVGEFKILTQYMVAGGIGEESDYNRLPMIPDLKKNAYFTNYRLKPFGQDNKELGELVGWAAASDITFLAPYMSSAMQDWTKNAPELIKGLNGTLFNLAQKIQDEKVQEQKNSSDSLPANPLKIIHKILLSLSERVGEDNKSILSAVTEKLIEASKNIPAANPPGKCNFITSKHNCSFYNILINGQEEVVLDSLPLSNLNPLISKDNIPEFIKLLSILDNNNLIQAFFGNNPTVDRLTPLFSVLSTFNTAGIKSNKLEDFLNYLLSSAVIIAKTDEKTDEYSDELKGKAVEFALNLKTLKENLPAIMKIIDRKDKENEKLYAKLMEPLTNRLVYPGSIIFLHNTEDVVVPFSQSIIAKLAMNSVFDAIYSPQKRSDLLIKSNIPALGSHIFAFQPENKFYNVEIGKKSTGGKECKKENAKYSNKCFGNFLLNKSGDGTLAHGDTAMRTARLIDSEFATTRADDSVLKNIMLFGSQYSNSRTQSNPSLVSMSYNEQFKQLNFNKSDYYNVNGSLDCSNFKQKTGICYLNTALDPAPLFNNQADLSSKEYDLYRSGAWNETASKSYLSPNDILNAWMDYTVPEVLKSLEK